MRVMSLARSLVGCLLPVLAHAQVSYYDVVPDYAGEGSVKYRRYGYANLNWSNPEDVRGELCLEGGKNGERPAKLVLRGTNPRAGVLRLTIPETARLRFALQPLVFKHHSLKSGYTARIFGADNTTVSSWEYSKDHKEVSLNRIPDDLHSLAFFDYGDDIYYQALQTPDHKSMVKFQLSNYDSLTKEQVLALEAANPPGVSDHGYERGVVLAVVPRSRLDDLRRFLVAEADGAAFEDPSYEACGAPFVRLDVSVPPLLEFYYARRLQASGLVVTAYPDVLGLPIRGSAFDLRYMIEADQ